MLYIKIGKILCIHFITIEPRNATELHNYYKNIHIYEVQELLHGFFVHNDVRFIIFGIEQSAKM